jgi:cell division protein FtsZ
MTLNLTVPHQAYTDFTPRITVIGVGGGGTNAVDNMIALNLQGVDFVVANTDAQQLMHSRADQRIQLGPHITQGLGAGANPKIGQAAAEEAAEELYRHLDGAHMLFITAGMGGGTGTGAAPVIARMARERNILTVGVVTKPFSFEGSRRARAAEDGIADLQQYVDTLIVIPNQNLFRMANERTTWREAFKMADHVLYMGVRGVTDLMMAPGLVNLDFADIRTVMVSMGKAMMGTGEAEGENRAIRAAEAAISNPLLEDTSMAGARGLLINITGGDDLTLFEVDQAATRIREEVDEDANIIFGSAIDENLQGKIRVSVVATGIDTQGEMVQQTQRPHLVSVGRGAPAPQIVPPPVMAAPVVVAVGNPGAPSVDQARPLQSPPMNVTMGAVALANPDPAPAMAPLGMTPPGMTPPGMTPLGIHPVMQPPVAEVPHAPVRAPMPFATPQAPARQARGGLFADPPAETGNGGPPPGPSREDVARPSLFQRMTGRGRRQPDGAPPPAQPEPAPEPQQRRAEPTFQPEPRVEPLRPTVRQGGNEEMGILDIPTFLRRQSS